MTKSGDEYGDDKDDWPSHDLGRWLVHRDDRLPEWVARSSRRALSPKQRRLVIARRRRWSGPNTFVMNTPPRSGASSSEAIWSFDVYDGLSWGRVVLPYGVMVESVALPEEDRLDVRFAVDDAVAGELGLATTMVDASLSPVRPALHAMEPSPGRNGVRAFAAVLASAGVLPGNVGTIAAEYAEEQWRVENERESASARRNASVWKAHVGRAGKARRGLGSLAKRLDEAIAAAGFRTAEGARADGADGALGRDLARFARLTVAAVVKQSASPSRLGTSRIGGLPDLPAGTDWPAIDGEPLSFILQIDLGAVPRRTRGMLPASGLLSLFLGRNDSTTRVEHRLLLSRRVGLRRCRPPGDAAFRDADIGVLEPFDLQLQPGLSLPDYESAELAALASRHPILGMKSGRYLEMRAGLDRPELIASLLGFPAGSQAVANAAKSVPAGRTGSRSRRDPNGWVSLLRVRSHAPARLSFWDAGELDILIPRTALARRSFDVTYAEITTG